MNRLHLVTNAGKNLAMKKILGLILCLPLMASCGSKSPKVASSSAASESPTSTVAATECKLEIAKVCGAGEVDGCGNALTTHHVCVAETETPKEPCVGEILRICPEGFVDACTTHVAKTRICVRM
jgi:hypothetical protein